MKQWALPALLIFSIIGGHDLAAFAQALDSLLLEAPDAPVSLLSLNSRAAAVRSRFVRLNPRLIGPASPLRRPLSRFRIDLFPGESVTAVTARVEQFGVDRWTASGQIEEIPGGHFLIAAEQDALAASVFLPGRGSFSITHGRDGIHVVRELDASKLPTCASDAPPTGRTESKGPAMRLQALPLGTLRAVPAASNVVTIVDVMALYTPEALAGAGGVAGMNTLIDLAVAEANMVYQNSQANLRVRLVHRGEINYVEAPSLATNLNRLQAKDDGFLDEVHGLRETNRADLVCLITEHSDPGVGGRAFTMGEPSLQFADRAFSIVQRASAVGAYIFAHEISHNMGCQHDRENASDETGKVKPGSYPFSFGHRFVADNVLYRTVMAYAPGEPIPYLSNPDVLFKGVPTGLPGTTNGANNALTVNLNAPFVGAFFGPLVRTAPPTIRLLAPAADAVFQSGANILVSAQATDTDGPVKQIEFYLESRLLGVVTNNLTGLTNLTIGSTNTFSVTWTNVPPGEYLLSARAVDLLGASTVSSASRVVVRPSNDNFSGRIVITGAAPSVSGSNRAGTLEPGEAMHAGNPGGHSVWYSWTAPKSGTVILRAAGQGILPLAEVYQSISPTALSSVTRRIDFDSTNLVVQATFDATAGHTYAIAIDSLADSGAGDFTFTLEYLQAPDNDDFANRLSLTGETIEVQAVNLAATLEPGEPKHADNPGGKSVWYSWVAPFSRPVIVTARATNFFPLLDVYTGSAIGRLTNVAQRALSFDTTNMLTTLRFSPVAGQTYAFAVDGFSGGSGVFWLTLQYPAPPANDQFTNRISISGTSVSLETSNAYATREPGEPFHVRQTNGVASIWYSWTAPVSGPVIVTARGEGFYPLPDVYTGTAVNALTNVPGSSYTFDRTNTLSTLVFDAVAFRTYALALDGFNGLSGKIQFSLNTANSPPSVRLFETLAVTNTGFRLRLFGSVGQRFVLQASTDLMAWTNIFGGTFATNSLPFTDENARNFTRRFYRALPLP